MIVRTLIVATKNKNKRRELRNLLRGLGLKVLGLSDLRIPLPRVIENGKTFRQNAIKKALTFSCYIDGLVLADDSGLVVDALDGKPGIRSSRFARTRATDAENNRKLLRLMRNVPSGKRQATFVCVVAVAERGNLLGTDEGTCRGTIGFETMGKNGFGYDPLFMPKGHKKTFAQCKASTKNRISHRAKAIRNAIPIIKKYL